MMNQHGLNQKFTFDKKELLDILKKNREEHAQIVKESREGWKEQTLVKLDEFMNEIEHLDEPKQMHFTTPDLEDYTDVYDTFIMQLEMARESELELDGDQFRKLVQDKWDWQERFLHTNAIYSLTAARKLR